MEALTLFRYAAELAVAAIILWAVVSFLPMLEGMKKAAQLLIVLVCLLSVFIAIGGSSVSTSGPAPYRPSTPATPSIIR